MEASRLARHWFLRTALAYLGTPYRWGGDDPSGFDCSGFVVECLKSAGLLAEEDDFTADGLMRKFESCQLPEPRPGALLLSLDRNGAARHVVICLDSQYQIGASGGDRTTASPDNAWEVNAFVKIRPVAGRSKFRRICDPFG